MSFLDSQFGLLKYEDVGRDIEFEPNPDGTIPKIKVRRAHLRHRSYMATITALIKKYKDHATNIESDDKVMMTAYSRAIVLGWSDILAPADIADQFGVKAGERIPFSPENVLKLFQARVRLFVHVAAKARDESFFEEKDDEETAKN